MGKKRLAITTAPKDDQLLAAVTKEDEKPSSPRSEEKVDDQDDEDLSSASSSSEAEEDEEEDDSSPSKNTTPPANSHLNPKTEDDSDSEDGEETDSDSEDEPAPKLKSLNSNSKPIDQIKSKAEPKPSSALARSGTTATKRPGDNDANRAKKRKTAAEKQPEEDNKKTGDDSKKLFQRVFNEDDEMAIIKGLHDFIIKTETDPFKYHTAFYDYVKKSIHFNVTLEQLRDKIRRLKLKYETKAKTGKTPNFSKQNDRIMFELSQKIWGGKFNVNEAEEKQKPNGKLSKREPAAKKPRTTKKLVLEPDSPVVVKETRKVERTDMENCGPSLALNELIRFHESGSASRETVGAMKRGVELMEESEREELARRWEKVQIAELEVFKMRADLAVDQAISILDTLKSSSTD